MSAVLKSTCVLFFAAQNAEVFDYVAKDIVLDCFKGINGCVFAYGQTGKKTNPYSMPKGKRERERTGGLRCVEALCVILLYLLLLY